MRMRSRTWSTHLTQLTTVRSQRKQTANPSGNPPDSHGQVSSGDGRQLNSPNCSRKRLRPQTESRSDQLTETGIRPGSDSDLASDPNWSWKGHGTFRGTRRFSSDLAGNHGGMNFTWKQRSSLCFHLLRTRILLPV